MKSYLQRVFCVLGLVLLATGFSPVRAVDTNSPPRLTVELRDGSRVVGMSVEKNFKFYSALLGEIKLDVSAIRTVDCVSSNFVKLTAANGDVMAVSFVDSTLAIKTSFGKVELAVNSVRKLSVSAGIVAGVNRPGLVSLWLGEGNAMDAVGGNNGTLVGGVSFAAGKVGQAFNFNGSNQYVSIADSPSLRPTSFTVGGWINFATTDISVIVGKPYGGGTSDSYAIWYEHGAINGVITTPSGDGPVVNYNWTPELGTWHHIAYMFDSVAQNQVLFLDGVSVGSGTVSGPVAYDGHDLLIGADSDRGSVWGEFSGLIDEVTIFNRALSADEIHSIYAEQK